MVTNSSLPGSGKAQSLLQAALLLEPADRPSFLAESCGVDRALREEVEVLLRESAESPGAGSGGARSRTDAGPHAIGVGQRVGPYKLAGRLGEGGMSEVFLGVRDDEQFEKRVAVKFLRTDLAGVAGERLRTERQILATLDHPNIAKLLDGGTTESGLPYLVMEYVDGLPIDEYCGAHGLGVERRLELFCQVCSAVQYAHRSLVIHRDLKASNILVSEDGVPRLLDFGIAKLLNPELAGQRFEPTRNAGTMLSVPYASPEQLRGQKVTTATDVYSLGVLLYLLLTGRLPHRLEGASPHRVATAVFDTEPMRPSLAVKGQEGPASELERGDGVLPFDLSRRLWGDLDAIVLKALRKEAEERYDSPRQLAADVRRYLEGHAVEARQGNLLYVARKFVRRHRLTVSLGTAAVLALLIFTATLSLQSSRLERALEEAVEQHQRAEDQRAKARAVQVFLEQTISPPLVDPEERSELTVVQALRTGAEAIDHAMVAEPELEAELRKTIGTTLLSLGEFERAEPLLTTALELIRDSRGMKNEGASEILRQLGRLRWEQGEYGEAERLLGESLKNLEEQPGVDTLSVVEAQEHLGAFLLFQGNYDESEPLLRRALETRLRVLGEEHPAVADTLHNLALLSRRKGDYERAEELYRRALQIQRRIRGEVDMTVAGVLNNLAVVLREQGDYDGAESLARRSLEILEAVHGEKHPNVARAQQSLAKLLLARGAFEEAESHFRRSLGLRTELLGESHPDVALVLRDLASLYRSRGELRRALGLYARALAAYREGLPPGHRLTAETRSEYAAVLTRLGRYGEAQEQLNIALRDLQQELGAEDERTRQTAQQLIDLYERRGMDEKAEDLRKELVLPRAPAPRSM